jgi:uncharacterized protein YbaR (Trm112 family)
MSEDSPEESNIEVRGGLSVDRRLLEVLVCPLTKSELTFDSRKKELVSVNAQLAFPIRDAVPIMLSEEARETDPKGPCG